MDGHAVPRLFVPIRPNPASAGCRKPTAMNSYPVFRDGSVKCVTHFSKNFRIPELMGIGQSLCEWHFNGVSSRPHVRLSTGRPVSQYAGNEGCAGLAGAEPHA
jgi:hypothetical protein